MARRATHLVVAADEARRVLAQRRGLRRGRGGLALGRLGAATQQLVVLGGQHKVAEQAADERRGLGAERLDVVERAQLRAQRAQRGLVCGVHRPFPTRQLVTVGMRKAPRISPYFAQGAKSLPGY